MCNLSKGVEEKGIQKGIEEMVSALEDLDILNDTIIQKLQEKFSLTIEEAQGYLKRC